MSAYALIIGGESVSTAQTFDVIDPATGRAFAQAPAATPQHVQGAMERAHAAFATWKRDEAARRAAIAAAADAIQGGVEPLVKLLSQEQGKPLAQAQREVLGVVGTFRYYAKLAIPVDTTFKDGDSRIEVHRRPFGVVAAVTPWNYPLLIASIKIATALLTGNTVVLKPSPYTPLSSLLLGQLANRALPPGVLNVLSGGDELGKLVCEHPLVRKISFTGSVATGKKVAAGAASDLKRVTLELGGNDPAIVLDDVDPKVAAAQLFWGAFTNSGQICTAIKRVYVHESVYEPLVAALSHIAKNTKVGPGLAPDSQLGPVNNAPQYRRVAELLDDAEQRGARFPAGRGPREGEGYFFDPVIVTDVTDDARIVAEEQFGPALPVLPFKDVDDALARANAGHFGLGASIWTRDHERGARLAAELDVGTAWVNQHLALSPLAPFGGSKWSGLGYENGPWGIDGFTQLQAVNVRAAK
ncbi:MAG: aldehyde dehydrogenase family protein [Polyangiales bacterium]